MNAPKFSRTMGHCSACNRGKTRAVVIVKVTGECREVDSLGAVLRTWPIWWGFCLRCCGIIAGMAKL